MKPVSMMLFAAAFGVFAVAGAGQAAERGNCPERGRCVVAPAPPPAPPAPPAPPELPALPPPPPLPTIPDAAHAACHGKAVGTSMVWSDKKGLRISGSCERDSKGMYLDATSIRSNS